MPICTSVWALAQGLKVISRAFYALPDCGRAVSQPSGCQAVVELYLGISCCLWLKAGAPLVYQVLRCCCDRMVALHQSPTAKRFACSRKFSHMVCSSVACMYAWYQPGSGSAGTNFSCSAVELVKAFDGV